MTDYDRHESEPWLGGVVQKIASLAASAMTAAFNCAVGEMCPLSPSVAMFDGRVFNVPEADVANYFLWRARDWARNSLSMFARSHFSHKQLHGKSRTAIHEMLHSVGANWATDVSPRMRNGAWFHRDGETSDIWCDYSEVSGLVESVLSPSHSSNA